MTPCSERPPNGRIVAEPWGVDGPGAHRDETICSADALKDRYAVWMRLPPSPRKKYSHQVTRYFPCDATVGVWLRTRATLVQRSALTVSRVSVGLRPNLAHARQKSPTCTRSDRPTTRTAPIAKMATLANRQHHGSEGRRDVRAMPADATGTTFWRVSHECQECSE